MELITDLIGFLLLLVIISLTISLTWSDRK